MGRYAFYLKVDKGSGLAMDNLSRWVKTVSLMGGDCYVLCDRDDVTENIKDRLAFSGNVVFLKSQRESMEIVPIVENAIPKNGMINAGYAHLTTFLHARD